MKLKIMTPDKIAIERDVLSVTLPGTLGQLTVMSGHDIMITTLKPGVLFFRYLDEDGKSKREDFQIGRGGAEVLKDGVRVYTSEFK